MKISLEDLKPYLQSLTLKQKEKLLYQVLRKDQTTMEKLYFDHVAGKESLEDRYLDFEDRVRGSLYGAYRAKSAELSMAKAITEAKKVINDYKKIDKRPEKEAALLLLILAEVFDDPDPNVRLGTCWTKYDHVVSQTLKRLITLITSKLHEDYWMDYKPQIDKYLLQLKTDARSHDFVSELPDEL